MSTDPYDALGIGYATRRRTDPRIADAISRAVGAAASVVNVGAGTGSYELGATVLAVEPSPTMIAQRKRTAAPVVRAAAEALPLADRCVEVALAVLTVHHWADPAAGLTEMVRVADRQVVLTWDATAFGRAFWLVAEYFPEIAEAERGLATMDTVVAELGRHHDEVRVTPVPVPADCVDGFLAAHWRDPAAYLEPSVRASASAFATLSNTTLERGLGRLADDLETGRWQARHADLLGLEQLDTGYRLVVAGPGA